MAWLDGLDIPFVAATDQGFFEFGPDAVPRPVDTRAQPLGAAVGRAGPATRVAGGGAVGFASRRLPLAHTDAALRAQLELEAEGFEGVVSAGHAGSGSPTPPAAADALPTIRTEMHRLRPSAAMAATRTSASSVWQVFAGSGTAELSGDAMAVEAGDVIAVPSWTAVRLVADHDGLDAFMFSDAPIFERLGLLRTGGVDRLATSDHPGRSRYPTAACASTTASSSAAYGTIVSAAVAGGAMTGTPARSDPRGSEGRLRSVVVTTGPGGAEPRHARGPGALVVAELVSDAVVAVGPERCGPAAGQLVGHEGHELHGDAVVAGGLPRRRGEPGVGIRRVDPP